MSSYFNWSIKNKIVGKEKEKEVIKIIIKN